MGSEILLVNGSVIIELEPMSVNIISFLRKTRNLRKTIAFRHVWVHRESFVIIQIFLKNWSFFYHRLEFEHKFFLILISIQIFQTLISIRLKSHWHIDAIAIVNLKLFHFYCRWVGTGVINSFNLSKTFDDQFLLYIYHYL